MSRYPLSVWSKAHYIGGVDQFDVLLMDDTPPTYLIVWGHSLGQRALLAMDHVTRPVALTRKLRTWGCFIAPEQAERICLLIKLFGPQEEV
jgi:hypothetical protein